MSTTARVQTAAGGGASAAWRYVLIALWLAWAWLLLGQALMQPLNAEGSGHIPRWARMASSAVLVVAGVVFYIRAQPGVARRVSGWIALGMAWGYLGDLFNADLVPIGLKDPVLGGIVSFGLGHLAYMKGTAELARGLGLSWSARRLWAIVFWQVVAAIGWYFCCYRGDPTSVLVWPALPYSLLLAGTAGMMCGVALEAPRASVMALGAALFLLSDMILAVRLFHGPFRLASDAVWLVYGPGQMLIVFGLAAVLGALALPGDTERRA